jgi:hypothetical protein
VDLSTKLDPLCRLCGTPSRSRVIIAGDLPAKQITADGGGAQAAVVDVLDDTAVNQYQLKPRILVKAGEDKSGWQR